MYALKVRINDESAVVGGAEDLGMLNAMVTCAGVLGSKSHPIGDRVFQHFHFRLGGVTRRGPGVQEVHKIWLERMDLKVGDKVQMEIVEIDQADPTSRTSDTQQAQSEERAYFDRLKEQYLALRSKYEPGA